MSSEHVIDIDYGDAFMRAWIVGLGIKVPSTRGRPPKFDEEGWKQVVCNELRIQKSRKQKTRRVR